VLVIGEVLCDLFSGRPGEPLAQTRHFAPHLGGAPANLAVQLAHAQVPVRLVSRVGSDPLGTRLRALLERHGVDVSSVSVDRDRRTGLTLVELDQHGERTFFGWRDNAADLSLSRSDVDRALSSGQPPWGVAHGTVSLRAPSSRAAVAHAVAHVKRTGGLVCLDVNLRFGMFKRREELLRRAHGAIKRSHVVKLSDEEATVLVGPGSTTQQVRRLLTSGPRLILLSRGANGATLANDNHLVEVRSPRVHAVDATGAGDAFFGAALAALYPLVKGPADIGTLTAAQLNAVATAACQAGARAVRHVGASRAPTAARPPSAAGRPPLS
jgi:fructokinase